jgi:hypothetical protein
VLERAEPPEELPHRFPVGAVEPFGARDLARHAGQLGGVPARDGHGDAGVGELPGGCQSDAGGPAHHYCAHAPSFLTFESVRLENI